MDCAGPGRAAEELDGAGVGRKPTVLARFPPPDVDQLAQLVRMIGRDIVALGEVVTKVEQPPLVVAEGMPLLVVGRDLPAVRPQTTVTHLLEVLHRPRRRGCRLAKRAVDGRPVHRDLRYAVVVVRADGA